MSQVFNLFTVCSVCALSGAVIVLTEHLHGHLSGDSLVGVQKVHTYHTARVGGIAIAFGLVVVWWLAAPGAQQMLAYMLLAGIPAFAFGLAEDFTKRVNVLKRLLATMASSLMASLLTGVAMQNTGLPPLDWALQWMPLAVLFTAFAVGGVVFVVRSSLILARRQFPAKNRLHKTFYTLSSPVVRVSLNRGPHSTNNLRSVTASIGLLPKPLENYGGTWLMDVS